MSDSDSLQSSQRAEGGFAESPGLVGSPIAFSAVIVCYNEAHLMRRCLASLDFCEEIIVVDVGSTDGSQELAEALGVRLLHHERHRVPNLARQFGISQARNEWVFTIDMDEVFPKQDAGIIEDIIRTNPELAAIRVPCQQLFRERALGCAHWGQPGRTRWAVVHRDRIVGTPYAHHEFLLDQAIYYVSWSEMRPIKHYWRDSYWELISKLWNHLPVDGESFYARGKRFSAYSMARAVASETKVNLINYRGLRGGLECMLLSLIRVVYISLAWMSLRRYEQSMLTRDSANP